MLYKLEMGHNTTEDEGTVDHRFQMVPEILLSLQESW